MNPFVRKIAVVAITSLINLTIGALLSGFSNGREARQKKIKAPFPRAKHNKTTVVVLQQKQTKQGK